MSKRKITKSAIDGKFVSPGVLPESHTVTQEIDTVKKDLGKLIARADEQGLEMVSVDELRKILEGK